MSEKENQPHVKRATRKWSVENMIAAYKAVKSGSMNLSKAAKKFGVPRMTLADRVKGRIDLNARWGNKTALSKEKEESLVSYIEYMAKRGFPLTIGLITGFAWCIATQSGKGHVFKKSGPTKRWWRGFQKRHPRLRLRRPDNLDRGRASMGNVWSLREYFSILKETMDFNDFHSNPQLVFNCDEAAINLNKSAGQKVVVPCEQKHAHSIASATNEHITVHCCVSASGGCIPPMVIFTKTFPGGAYHKKGPINATYAISDTGFMDQDLYFQWFEKTFLKYAPAQRPLLLIQDGASSHISCPLNKCAIANDVIILCLPPKTTYITQPLDVAVYRKMKIETAKIMGQAKLIKSDLWVAKKNVSQMFRVIYESSFTMNCITEGFRKCGIFPFNPNAVDKTLLLRSCDIIDEEDIDLSISNTQAAELRNTDPESNISFNRGELPLTSTPLKSEKTCVNDESQPMFQNISFLVGDDGILTLSSPDPDPVINDVLMNAAYEDNVSACPPELALAAVELTLTPRKKRRYHECLNFNVDLPNDNVYQTWKVLKEQVVAMEPVEDNIDEMYSASKLENEENKSIINMENMKLEHDQKRNTPTHHPLVKAGLISETLAEILTVPDFEAKSNSASFQNRGRKKARILTSLEVEKELEGKENIKKEKEEKIKQRKIKQMERKAAIALKKEEIKKRREQREKIKQEKLKTKSEKCKIPIPQSIKMKYPAVEDNDFDYENTNSKEKPIVEKHERSKLPTKKNK